MKTVLTVLVFLSSISAFSISSSYAIDKGKFSKEMYLAQAWFEDEGLEPETNGDLDEAIKTAEPVEEESEIEIDDEGEQEEKASE